MSCAHSRPHPRERGTPPPGVSRTQRVGRFFPASVRWDPRPQRGEQRRPVCDPSQWQQTEGAWRLCMCMWVWVFRTVSKCELGSVCVCVCLRAYSSLPVFVGTRARIEENRCGPCVSELNGSKQRVLGTCGDKAQPSTTHEHLHTLSCRVGWDPLRQQRANGIDLPTHGCANQSRLLKLGLRRALGNEHRVANVLNEAPHLQVLCASVRECVCVGMCACARARMCVRVLVRGAVLRVRAPMAADVVGRTSGPLTNIRDSAHISPSPPNACAHHTHAPTQAHTHTRTRTHTHTHTHTPVPCPTRPA